MPEKYKDMGRTVGVGKGSAREQRASHFLQYRCFPAGVFRGMEALMLSSVLDVLLHRTLVNPSVQHLWVLHSFPTERARTAY